MTTRILVLSSVVLSSVGGNGTMAVLSGGNPTDYANSLFGVVGELDQKFQQC